MCFFFKQKTAYEMRISDWSSDVCSSDLFIVRLNILQQQFDHAVLEIGQDVEVRKLADAKPGNACLHDGMSAVAPEASLRPMDHLLPVDLEMPCAGGAGDALMPGQRLDRSEEHTSELQSLMRISYAVFCLKKQKIHTQT